MAPVTWAESIVFVLILDFVVMKSPAMVPFAAILCAVVDMAIWPKWKILTPLQMTDISNFEVRV